MAKKKSKLVTEKARVARSKREQERQIENAIAGAREFAAAAGLTLDVDLGEVSFVIRGLHFKRTDIYIYRDEEYGTVQHVTEAWSAEHPDEPLHIVIERHIMSKSPRGEAPRKVDVRCRASLRKGKKALSIRMGVRCRYNGKAYCRAEGPWTTSNTLALEGLTRLRSQLTKAAAVLEAIRKTPTDPYVSAGPSCPH